MSNPDIIFIDEPLSGQGEDSQKTFIKEIKRLTKNKVAVVMISHKLRLVEQLADEVYCIKDGFLNKSITKEYELIQCISLLYDSRVLSKSIKENVVDISIINI